MFVYFYRKILKKNPLLNKEVSSESAEKEFWVLNTSTFMKCIASMKTSGKSKTLKSLYTSMFNPELNPAEYPMAQIIGAELKQKLEKQEQLSHYLMNASAKSRSVRGASHQPAFMSSCLAIIHTCLPCLPSGRASPSVPGVI